jgi:hypothetical protein
MRAVKQREPERPRRGRGQAIASQLVGASDRGIEKFSQDDFGGNQEGNNKKQEATEPRSVTANLTRLRKKLIEAMVSRYRFHLLPSSISVSFRF